MTTKKKISFSLATTLAAVLAVVAIAEWRLRVKYKHITAITGVTGWSPIVGFGGYVKQWDEYSPTRGWTTIPNYRSDANAPFVFTTNSEGLRANREYGDRAAKGTYRIAMFGDSCTFGQEVHDGETVPDYLEKSIPNCEVLNYGVPAYGFGQAAQRLCEEGFAKHPDHVVFLVLVPWMHRRDLWTLHHHPKPWFDADGDRLIVRNTPVPGEFAQPLLARHLFSAAWANNKLTARFDAPPASKTNDVAMAVQKHIRDECDKRNIRFTQVNFTLVDWVRVIESNPAELADTEGLCRAMDGNGVDTLDLVPFMRDMWHKEGPSVEAPAHHLTARGNRLLAERISLHIKRQLDSDILHSASTRSVR